MQHCDVLIVGGGPAGSSCARQLVEAGMDVLVLDKARFPRDKVCAGWITPPVLSLLEIDHANYARGRVLQPIRSFQTALIGGELLRSDYDEIQSYGIRRCEFDHYLLQRSGARVIDGEAVKSIRKDGELWVVNERFTASMLVGAGGHFCPVARWLNRKKAEHPVVAKEMELQIDDSAMPADGGKAGVPELYFCPDLNGYGWVFRKGAYLNIGLGRVEQGSLSEHLNSFIDWLEARRRIPAGLERRLHGHAYLTYAHRRQHLVADGVMLLGDAAGLAYAASGEGILPAVESGLLGARALIEAGCDYRKASLNRYVAMLERIRGRSGRMTIADRVPAGIKAALARPLFATSWFARRVLIEKWFLHSGEAMPQKIAV